MKNKLFIAGLVFSLLVSGCCNKTDGVPTKTKYSNEVSYAEFDEKIDKVFDDDSLAEGYSFTTKSRIDNKTTMKLVDKNNAKVGNAVSSGTYDYNGKYDHENNVSYVSTVGSRKTTINVNGEKQSDSDKADFSRIYQPSVAGEGEVAHTYSINKKAKEYYDLGELDNNEPAAQTVKLIALPILFYALGTASFDSKTQAEKDKWKFYIDGDVFTATYTTQSVRQESEYVDGADHVYAETRSTEVDLIQIKGKKSEDHIDYLSCYFEMISEKTTYYIADHDDDGFVFEEGQTLTQNSALKIGVRLDAAVLTIKPINLDEYTLKDVDEEAEEHEIFSL